MQDFNKDVSEFGRGSDSEYHIGVEQRSYSENSYVERPVENSEFASTASKPKRKTQKKKKLENFNLSSMLTSFVVVVAVVVVGVTGGLMPVDVQASIVEFGGEYDSIFYHIEVTGDAPVEAVLYNDFTKRSVPLEQGANAGVFNDLKPGLKYTLAVVQNGTFGDKTITKQTIYTSSTPPYVPKTEWYGVTHECTCNVDGYFHFTMDFVDELGYYSEFEATLTDAKGSVGVCTFTDNLLTEQRIDVALDNYLTGNTATFVITCISMESGVPVEIELYRYEVKI